MLFGNYDEKRASVRRAPSGVSAYLTVNVNWFYTGKRLGVT
jgi:hypothetical protein